MKTTLTGKIRYRLQKRLFRKPLLVLQVEINHKGTSYSSDPFDYGRDYDFNNFEDATFEDLQILNTIKKE